MAISVLLLPSSSFCAASASVMPQKLHFFITFRSVTTHEEDGGGGGGDAIIILKHWRRGLVGQRERERETTDPRRILCRVAAEPDLDRKGG